MMTTMTMMMVEIIMTTSMIMKQFKIQSVTQDSEIKIRRFFYQQQKLTIIIKQEQPEKSNATPQYATHT